MSSFLKMNVLSLVALCCVAVKAAPIQPEEITVTEGDNVTLASGVDIGVHCVLKDDNEAFLLDCGTGLVSGLNNRIHWDSGTRSIIITSAQMDDSKTYHLETFPNSKRKTVTIKLNVTERLSQATEDPSPGPTPESISAQQRQRGRVGVYISLGLIVAVAFAVRLIICWKKRRSVSSASPPLQFTQRPTEELLCCMTDTGAGSSGSTSRSDSVHEPEMEDQLMPSKQDLKG